MSLVPAVFVLLGALLYSFASSRVVNDNGLLMSQQQDGLLAQLHAEIQLARWARVLAAPAAEPAGDRGGSIDSVPSAVVDGWPSLPPTLQRVTVIGDAGHARVRLQADFAIDGCAQEEACVTRVRRIAWRQLPSED